MFEFLKKHEIDSPKALEDHKEELARQAADIKQKRAALEARQRELTKQEALLQKYEAKKQQLEQDILERQNTFSELKKAVTRIAAEQERFEQEKKAVADMLEKDQELKRVIQQKERAATSQENMLQERIKTFEVQQAHQLIASEKKIRFQEQTSAAKLAVIEYNSTAAERTLNRLRETIAAERALLSTITSEEKHAHTKLDDTIAHVTILRKELSTALTTKKMIADQQEALQQTHADFQKQQQAWQSGAEETRRQFRQKETQLSHYERELSSKASALGARERSAQKLLQHVTELEAKKKEALIVIAERRQFQQQKNKLLEELQKTATTEEDLTRQTTTLQEQERTITAAQARLDSTDLRLKKTQESLTQERSILEKEITAAKNEFEIISKKRDQTIKDLQSELSFIRTEKDKLKKLVDKDIIALKQKEQEIVLSVADLDKARERLERDENSLVKQLHLFEREKKQHDLFNQRIKQREKEIHDREEKISTGRKDLVEEKKKLDVLLAKQADVTTLKKQVKELTLRRAELRKTVTKAERARDRLAAMATQSSATPEITEKQVPLQPQKIVSQQQKQPQPADIPALIADAKENITAGNIPEAQTLIKHAETLLVRVKDTETKRAYWYDLQELKTNIKLATLA